MRKRLVLDANILISAVVGNKIHKIISQSEGEFDFLTAEEAFSDAKQYVPKIISKRGGDNLAIEAATTKLELLEKFIQTVPVSDFVAFEDVARKVMKTRDEDDWLYLALALHFDCPIWTEDKDFFGCGVAIWTTNRIKYFLGAEEI